MRRVLVVAALALAALALGLGSCSVDLSHWRQGAACAHEGGEPCPPGQTCSDDDVCLAACTAAGACAPDPWNEGATFTCRADGLCHFACGAAGDTCPAGLTCNVAAGVCRGTAAPEILAPDQDQPASIAVDATSVYWTNSAGGAGQGGSVMKAPLAGGSPITLATGQDYPDCVVVDATSVYWVNLHGDAVMKAPLGGGAPVPVAPGLRAPGPMAIDTGSVYFTAEDSMGSRQVLKVPKVGGAPVVLASVEERVHDLAVDATSVYWLAFSGGAGTEGAVWTVPRAGGTPALLATVPGLPLGLVLDATNVYGLSSDDSLQRLTLWRVPLAGGSLVTLATGAAAFRERQRPAVDATHAYFGRSQSGMGGLGDRVVRVPLAGGVEEILASQLENIGGSFAVDATSVYFSAGKYPYGNAIMRVPK